MRALSPLKFGDQYWTLFPWRLSKEALTALAYDLPSAESVTLPLVTGPMPKPGVPMMALSFYALLVLLSWEPISLVIPASALSYVVGTLGAKYILREQISMARWAGVLLVCAGVALVAAG